MSQWEEMNDFSAWDKRIPCVLCKKDAEKTLVGEHWKCGTCDHLFNQDASVLPEGVLCYCEVCNPKKKKEQDETGIEKMVSKLKKLTSKKPKRKTKKVKKG